MTIYAFGSFSILLFNVVLWAFILRNRKKDVVIWSYLLWSIAVSGWSLGYGITLSGCFNESVTLFWNRFCHANALFIGVFFLQLAYALTHQLTKNKRYLLFIYGVGISLLILDFTPLLVQGLWKMSFFTYQPLGGPAYPYFTGFFFFTIIHGLWVLYRRMRSTQGQERSQLKIFLVGTMIGYAGGANLFLQAFHLNILPIGVFFISSYVLFAGYAIYKYGFLDIEQMLKKALAFASLFIIVFGIFMGITLLSQQLIVGGKLIGLAVSSIIIILSVRPLESFLLNITDKYFFQKKYDYKELLKTFSDEVLTVLELNKLVNVTVEKLMEILKLENVDLFLPIKENSEFMGTAINQLDDLSFTVKKDSELVRFLQKKKYLLYSDPSLDSYTDTGVNQELVKLKAWLVIPLTHHGDIIGILSFGRKKSGKNFNVDDIDILLSLGSTLSLAIKNATYIDELNRSYEDNQAAQEALFKTQRIADLGYLATAMGHSMKNNLNIMLLNAQRALRGVKIREALDQYPEAREKLDNHLDAICKYGRACEEMIKNLKKKSMPQENVKLDEDVILQEAIEQALYIVKMRHQETIKITGKVEVEQDIMDSPAVIKGNNIQIQEIITNILNNSFDAIVMRHSQEPANTPKGVIKITLNENSDFYMLHFIDNGIGMTEDIKKRVFNIPMFTTKGSYELRETDEKENILAGGTGIGAFYVSVVVEAHKGKAGVHSSEVLKGTDIYLELPKRRASDE